MFLFWFWGGSLRGFESRDFRVVWEQEWEHVYRQNLDKHLTWPNSGQSLDFISCNPWPAARLHPMDKLMTNVWLRQSLDNFWILSVVARGPPLAHSPPMAHWTDFEKRFWQGQSLDDFWISSALDCGPLKVHPRPAQGPLPTHGPLDWHWTKIWLGQTLDDFWILSDAAHSPPKAHLRPTQSPPAAHCLPMAHWSNFAWS